MLDTKNQTRSSSSVGGLAVLTGVVLIVLAWMFYHSSRRESSNDARRVPTTSTAPSELVGFRADAWYLPDDEWLGFVEVPGGPFTMGSDPALDSRAFDNERWSTGARQGTVDLQTFYIGRYEVTVAQFRTFVEATGFAADAQALVAPPAHPVSGVSWPDALAYSRWLEERLSNGSAAPEELARLLRDGWRVSLPSEAEWEKAARSNDGRLYPWGDEPRRDRANYAGTGTTPVGRFECLECPFGLFDMSGNVWEWTRSPFQPYPYDPTDDSEGLDADALWVMRGGHFGDPQQYVRTAVRGAADPGVHRPFIGFRLAISRF